MATTELAFEDAIENILLANGYLKSKTVNYDATIGLDVFELFDFIESTQPKKWDALVARGYGGVIEEAKRGFSKRLAAEIDVRGTVDVLRHGVSDFGVAFEMAFFKPAHNLTPERQRLFEANRVTVTRQFKFDPNSELSIDMAILVNGLLTATAELKNPLTNQTVEHAIAQYRNDRDPANLSLSRRALVHFAVDPDLAAMTTKLAGQKTVFLPFNQGTGGAGRSGKAGNPPSSTGHRTAYLWEQVWEREAWLDILSRFIHVETSKKGSQVERAKKRRVIFPRFHQWDAVRKLEASARAFGPGTNYLIQHSAGSGKSNTIGWIAHRLANLHNLSDQKVFDKVIVITDRIVLDEQLQETIYQFEHAKGVVVKIDKNSEQLAEALMGEQAKIIITTLQKFPFVLGKMGEAKARNYAVIVDEAHSSQTGRNAKEIRAVLAKGQPEDKILEDFEVLESREEVAEGDSQDQLISELGKATAGRGRQANISFFAFTATPKAKTLELFGQKIDTLEGPHFAPFHLYSMRQAIDEGFILNVLKNYSTYKTYWQIEKKIADDPEHDKARAKAAIARFVSLHPTNLAQKAEIIVEHFRQHTSNKIGGRAKAMVVTSSRLHAIRYKQAIDKYIAEHQYEDIASIVAFSGSLVDEDIEYTELKMNGFTDKEIPEKFESEDYQVLIVAEKFQTGFDQPLLHTMYVDKVLSNLNAVQTLSRLNRTADEKIDTFVLDFRNSTEDIEKAFAPWFEETYAIPTDPNLLWDTHNRFMASPIIREEEVFGAVKELLAGRKVDNHAQVYATLDPALARFEQADLETQNEFRDQIGRYISMYGFIAQIVSFTDEKLERDYIYARALEARLPRLGGERIDIGSEVKLTHLRTEQKETGSVILPDRPQSDLEAYFPGGGEQREPEKENLSAIVKIVNEHFGTQFSLADQVLFDQFEAEWEADPEIIELAKNNHFENFLLVAPKKLEASVLSRVSANDAILSRIFDNKEFKDVFLRTAAQVVYEKLHSAA